MTTVGAVSDHTKAAQTPRPGDDRWDQVAKALAIGGGAGLGLAGIAGIIREIGLQKAYANAMKDPAETDENTIILTVPRRKVAALKAAVEKTGAGIFADFAAQDAVVAPSYRTYVARSAALPLGALAAFILVDKLHSKAIDKRLKAKEERARSEFVDRLGTKQASDMDWVLGVDDVLVKSADGRGLSNPAQNIVNRLLGPLGILTLLGAGGTAYITKRVMDAKDDARSSDGWDPPKIKRVVVRSAPLAVDTEEEKVASASDIDGVRAAIAVTMSALSGRCLGVLDSEASKQAMAEAGTSKAELYAMAEKQGQDQGSRLAELLQGNAKLRAAVLDQAPKSHPILGSLTWNNAGESPNYLLPQLLKAAPRGIVDKMTQAPLAEAAQKHYDSAGMIQRWQLRRAMKDPVKFNKRLINNPKLLDRLTAAVGTAAGPANTRAPINLKPIVTAALPALAGAAATTITPKGLKWLPMAAGIAGSAYLANKQVPGGIIPRLGSGIKDYASPGAKLNTDTAKAAAFLPSVSGITSSFLGSTAANREDKTPREHGAELAGKQVAMVPSSSLNALAGRIRLEADPDDAEAQAFLVAKRTRLSKVLKQLLAEGELRAI